VILTDSRLIIQVNSKKIEPSEIGLNDFKVENVIDLQQCLKILDSFKCFQGAISCSKSPDIKSSYGFQYV